MTRDLTEEARRKARTAFAVANGWTYDQLINFVVKKLVEEYDVDEMSQMALVKAPGIPGEAVYGRGIRNNNERKDTEE